MALVTAPAALPMQVTINNTDSQRHLQVVPANYRVVKVKQPVKLTRRGRRLVALLAILPIVAVFFLMGTRGAQADSSAEATTSSVVVKPGQSLWDIAVNVDPNADPRETIWVIEQLNGMKTADVLAGQELIVPAAK